MSNRDIIERLTDAKIIAIIRGVAPERMIPLVQALTDGGVCCLEITYDQKEKDGSRTFTNLKTLAETFGDGICLGAGTVLTPEQAVSAVEAGARYIISPNTDAAVIRAAKQAGAVSMPGAMTPTEAIAAYQAGADIVKLFPAGDLGVGYFKAIRAPLSHIPFCAVGGITVQNAAPFLNAGACCLGVGGNLANAGLANAGFYNEITEAARLFTLAVKDIA